MFPYTAGVFPFKRQDEDPTRMFAGEGDPFRTNRRFKYLSENYTAKRLSTAFDSVTLYGRDPEERPDIYGKVGTSGVSICTLDDVKELYSGFDLSSPNTSVSMTINGPAPMMLAMFFNTAIDQQLEKFRDQNGREPTPEAAARIKADVLCTVRGTIQADILKEDQGQNTCIFSTDFSLKMMGDIQEYFIRNNVRTSIPSRSPAITSRRQERTRSPSWRSPWPMGSPTWNTTSPGDAYRRLRSESFLLLLQRPGTGVQRDRPGRTAHLGRCDEGKIRRQRTVPEIEVPHPNERPVAARAGHPVQRHTHDASGAHCHLRQLQFTPYQLVRRGHHHAHRGVGSPGTRDPVDHQQRMGNESGSTTSIRGASSSRSSPIWWKRQS